MRIIGVAAADENNGIGKGNKIPWKFPKDLQWFSHITNQGHNPAVLMGRKTYISIGCLLPTRINAVISSTYATNHYKSIPAALNDMIKRKVDNCYIIGGATIYNWFAQHLLYDEFYLTNIHSDYSCDTTIEYTMSTLTNKYLRGVSRQFVQFDADLDISYYYKTNTDEMAFQQLIKHILAEPLDDNRTMYKTHTLMNQMLRFNLIGGIFPASVLRRQWLKGIFWELQWFLNGRTDLAYLHDKGVHIWDANCSKSALEAASIDLPPGEVGAIYGHQWRNFGVPVGHEGYDQIAYVIDQLKNNPKSRRIMLSSWCPPMIFDSACLPPCHVSYNFNVKTINGKNYLYCMITQRSSDVALALSWNIISGAFLTYLLGKVCDLIPAEVSICIANAHIYENHILGSQEMLTRDVRAYPRIEIPTVKEITDYTFDDMVIYNYDPHNTISIGSMAI